MKELTFDYIRDITKNLCKNDKETEYCVLGLIDCYQLKGQTPLEALDSLARDLSKVVNSNINVNYVRNKFLN